MTRLSQVHTPDGPRQVNPALVSQRQARSAALSSVEELLAARDRATDAALLLMLPGCPDPCEACHDAAAEDAAGDAAAEREPAEEEA